MGKTDELKQKTKGESTQEAGAKPVASKPAPGESAAMPSSALSHQGRPGNSYDSAAVEAVAAQSRRLQRLMKDIAQARTVLGYKEWPGDRPAALAAELERHATLAVALQEAAADRADGEAMLGLSRLQAAATLLHNLDENWLWLLEPEQRGLKDNYTALRRGLTADLLPQVGEILASPATAVERLRTEILEVAGDTFTRQAAYDAIVAEVSARTDQAIQRGNRGEADTLWQIVEKAAEPWIRQRGLGGRLRRLFSRRKSSHQRPSSTSWPGSSYSEQRVPRPHRRTYGTTQSERGE